MTTIDPATAGNPTTSDQAGHRHRGEAGAPAHPVPGTPDTAVPGTDEAGPGSGPGPLGAGEKAAAWAVAVLVGLLGLIGALNSFRRVAHAVRPSFGDWAWTVPLGVDVGIAAFTALDLVMARLGMRLWWLRAVPWALVAATIYLNVSGEHTPVGAVAHAVLPALWVIAVEAAGHVVRSRAGLAGHRPLRRRMDRVRASRWLLAPVSTGLLRRRMILWDIVSYPDALARERARLLVKTDMQDRWGRLSWRWRAPRRERVLYRLGDLAPTGALPTLDPAEAVPGPSPDRAGTVPTRRPSPAVPEPGAGRDDNLGRSRGGHGDQPSTSPSPPGRKATRPSPPARARRRRPTVPALSDDELLAEGRAVAAGLSADGRPLTRKALIAGLRARGHRFRNDRAAALIARLREGPDTPDPHAITTVTSGKTANETPSETTGETTPETLPVTGGVTEAAAPRQAGKSPVGAPS